jgi:hypothetical protein
MSEGLRRPEQYHRPRTDMQALADFLVSSAHGKASQRFPQRYSTITWWPFTRPDPQITDNNLPPYCSPTLHREKIMVRLSVAEVGARTCLVFMFSDACALLRTSIDNKIGLIRVSWVTVEIYMSSPALLWGETYIHNINNDNLQIIPTSTRTQWPLTCFCLQPLCFGSV